MAGITHSTVADGLAVDTGSKAARVSLWEDGGNRLTKLEGQATNPSEEGLIIAGVNDGNVRHLRTDRLGNVTTAAYSLLLSEPFEGASLATNRWSSVSTTMTGTQSAAAGFLFNASSITTINTGYLIRSLRMFPKIQRAPLHFKCRARVAHIANSVAEFGFGDSAAVNTAHVNGAYFQYTSGGVIQPVLTYNSVDTFGTAITGLSNSNYYTWDIILDDDSARYVVQDTVTGAVVAERTIFLASTQPKLWSATRLYAFARLYNTASAPASASQMIVSGIDVLLLDTATIPWKEQMASFGHSSSIQPVTWAQTANWANSAAPTNAALSNTVAGYATLGGNFSFAAVAGAVTDYVLFGFAAPVPYSYVCTGIDIETFNTGAAVATTATVLMWGVGVDQLAASLVSAGAIKTPVGIQSLQVGAAIGATCTRLSVNFDVPLVTNPGRFFTIILRMPIGTATASQVIQGMASCRGYFQ